MNTLRLGAENLIKIGSVVSEIWPGKFKSREAHLFKQVRLFLEMRYKVLEHQLLQM